MSNDDLAQLAPKVLLEAIAEIDAGSAVYKQQDDSKVTFAPKLKKSDGFIDFSEPAETIAAKIRGLSPWPGAQADYVSSATSKCCRVTIAHAEVVPSYGTDSGRYGLFNDDLNVICGKDALKIIRIKPAGGGLMDFRDFVNGRATKPGDLLMSVENK